MAASYEESGLKEGTSRSIHFVHPLPKSMSDLIMILLVYLVTVTKNTGATRDYFPSLPLWQRLGEEGGV